MKNLKRLEVKYVRDGIKSRYPKKVRCYITGTTEELELHHYHTVSELWNNWKKANNIEITSQEDIKAVREAFYLEYEKELLEDVVTLCHHWHQDRLHKLYGQNPKLSTAAKQKRWVERMRIKHDAKMAEKA